MPITIDACVAQHIGDRKGTGTASVFSASRSRAASRSPSSPTAWGNMPAALAAEQVLYTARNNPRALLGRDDSANDAGTSINEAQHP